MTKKSSRSTNSVKIEVTCLGSTWYGVLRCPAVLAHNPRIQEAASVQLAASNMPDAVAEAGSALRVVATKYAAALEHGLPEGETITGPDALGMTMRNHELMWRAIINMDKDRRSGSTMAATLSRDFDGSAMLAVRMLRVMEIVEGAKAVHPQFGLSADIYDWTSVCREAAELPEAVEGFRAAQAAKAKHEEATRAARIADAEAAKKAFEKAAARDAAQAARPRRNNRSA